MKKKSLSFSFFALLGVGLISIFTVAVAAGYSSEPKSINFRGVSETEVPPLYGTVINGDSIYGIFALSGTEPSGLIPVKRGEDFTWWNAVLLDDKLYAFSFYPGVANREYRIINPFTWEIERRIPAGNETGTGVHDGHIRDMAFDYSTGVTYAITTGPPFINHPTWLSIVDVYTGKVTRLGNLFIDRDFDNNRSTGSLIIALAVNKSGIVYGVATDGRLYTIDPKTVEATRVAADASCGAIPNLNAQGLTFNEDYSKLYWAANLEGGVSRLYEIDPETGVFTEIDTYGVRTQISTLFHPVAPPSPAAPAKAANLQFTEAAPGGSTGIFSFTAPNKTIDGDDLTGTLTGEFRVGTTDTISFVIQPGAVYTSAPISIGSDYFWKTISVVVTNSSGTGSAARTTFWGGFDVPNPATELKYVLQDEKPVLTWDAPIEGVHSGVIDFDNLKYKIVRLPDGVVLAEAHVGTTFTDNSLPTEMASYYYSVTPFTEQGQGDPVRSNEMVLGVPFQVPFTEGFDSERFKIWKIFSLEGSSSWIAGAGYYNSDGNNPNEYKEPNAQSRYSSNSWLVSPPIHLKAGAVYSFSYSVRSYNPWGPAQVRVYYGKSPDNFTAWHVDDSNTAELPSNFLIDHNFTLFDPVSVFTHTIVIPHTEEDADYSFAFQAYFQNGRVGAVLDDVSVVELVGPGAPDAIQNLTLTPDNTGENKVTISFDAPETTMSGAVLTGTLDVDIYRTGSESPITSIAGVTPGETKTWVDEYAVAGNNIYRFIANNIEGRGLELIDSVYVGWDKPEAISELRAQWVDGSAVLSWDAPTIGEMKGSINTAELKYVIYRDGRMLTEVAETTYADEIAANVQQHFVTYSIRPYTNEGFGRTTSSKSVRIGKACALPFTESFAGARFENQGWTNYYSTGDTITFADYGWVLRNDLLNELVMARAQDGDNGLIAGIDGTLNTNNQSRLFTPVLDFSSVENPKLSFWFFHYSRSRADQSLILKASSKGSDFDLITNDTIRINENNNGWTLYEYNLPSYAASDSVVISFDYYMTRAEFVDILLDNIQIKESFAKDADAFAMTMPDEIVAGYENNHFEFVVRNAGFEAIPAYKLTLFANGEPVASADGNSIAVQETDTLSFDLAIDIDVTEESYEYHAVIEFEGDQKESNNTFKSVVVPVSRSYYEAVSNLNAEVGGDEESAILTWDAPVAPTIPVRVIDGFETYEAFVSGGFGEWTVIDNDGRPTVEAEVPEYSNKGAAMAFQVSNLSAIYRNTPSVLRPYDGLAVAFSAAPTSGVADDWLISPRLHGSKQTISFYAWDFHSVALFEVYYSTTDTNESSFSSLLGAQVQATSTWTKYSYELPKGTKYFAIRKNLPAAAHYFFSVDNAAFAKEGESAEVLGYAVYRNGEKISELPAAATTYTDNETIDGINTYSVVTVYDKNTSEHSDEVSLNIEKSNSIFDNRISSFVIYTEKSTIVVDKVAGESILLTDIQGRLIEQRVGTGNNRFDVLPGIYLVKVGTKVSKVVVY